MGEQGSDGSEAEAGVGRVFKPVDGVGLEVVGEEVFEFSVGVFVFVGEDEAEALAVAGVFDKEILQPFPVGCAQDQDTVGLEELFEGGKVGIGVSGGDVFEDVGGDDKVKLPRLIYWGRPGLG